MTTSKTNLSDLLMEKGELTQVKMGERVARPDEFTPMIYRVKKGTLRLLFASCEKQGVQTLCKIEKGDWVGLSNLIYGEPCEWVTESSDVFLEAISTEALTKIIWTD